MVRIPTHGPPTHPGEMILEEFLRPLGMTQTEFAQRIGVAWTRANQVIKGRRGVTPDTVLRLEKLFDMPADFWLTLQLRWDLYHAMRSPAAKEIDKITRAPGMDKRRRSAR
ncbi:MAG TPA: HigA family addiction module antitoxin [Gemmatimonadaceae bacterium]